MENKDQITGAPVKREDGVSLTQQSGLNQGYGAAPASLQADPYGPPPASRLEDPGALEAAGETAAPPRASGFSLTKRLLVKAMGPLLGLVLIAAGFFGLDAYRSGQQGHGLTIDQFNNVSIPLDDLTTQDGGLALFGPRTLTINGTLEANQGVVVTPTAQPSAAAEGQIYYDQGRNELGYYNGSQFIYLGQQELGVSSLGGATGDIALGSGIQLIGGQLSAAVQAETPDGDSVTGNEITTVATGAGLVRTGAGTTLNPFAVGLITCQGGQLLKSTGPGAWACGTDVDTDTNTTYTAGTGISFSGTSINNTGVIDFDLLPGSGLANTGTAQNIALKLRDCANGQLLQYDGTDGWECQSPGGGTVAYSFTISDQTTSQDIDSGNTVTFIGNEGLVATVGATDQVTYGLVDGGVTTIKLADGAVTTTKITDGTVATVDLADGSVTSGKIADGAVANTDLANDSLTVNAGVGLAGGGVVALGGSTTLSLQACADGQVLKYDTAASDYLCANDNGGTDDQTLSIASTVSGTTVTYDLAIEDGNTVSFDDRDTNTLYSAATGGGLALNGAAFSLQACADGEILKYDSGTGTWSCAPDGTGTDSNTTYMAGTGLSLTGTTFNVNVGTGLGTDGSNNLVNEGVLTVSAATTAGNLNQPIALGGTAQNPTVGFSDGANVGDFWQWNGTEWALATLPTDAEGDDAIGNEVIGVTGTSNGLTRSGTGTSISPYTLAVNVGTGLSINASNQIQNDGVLSFDLGASTALVDSGNAQDPVIDLKACGDGEVLRYNATTSTWDCISLSGATSYSFSISDGITSEAINDGNTVTFIGNEGLLATVSAGDQVTYGIADGGVTTVKLATGAVVEGKIADGAVTTIKLADGAVTSGKIADGGVANVDLANDSLSVNSGIGLEGGGVAALGGSTVLSLQACADGQVLKYDGTTSDYLCAADEVGGDSDGQTLTITSTGPDGNNTVNYELAISGGNSVFFDDRDTLYTAATSGGLALNAGAFSLTACPSGQVLRSTGSGTYSCSDAPTADTNTTYDAGSGLTLTGTTFSVNAPTCSGTDKLTWNGTAFVCASDEDTTYQAGTGIGISGTTINNTGVLTIAAATTGGNVNQPITLGGTTQDPTVGFSDGANIGDIWQWNGTAWVLNQLPADQVNDADSVVGNEVTGVTGTASGLTRSGAGTAVDPYTLAVNVGTGLSINASNQITNDGVISFGLGASTALVNSGTGQNPLIDLKPCADGEVMRYDTTTSTWQCVNLSSATNYSFDISDGTTAQTVGNTETVTFIGNEGLVATVSAGNNVTFGIVDGQVTTVKMADGSVTTGKIADGTIATIDLSDGSVTNAKLANDSLTVSAGIGLTGGGVVALGTSTTLDLTACADGQILKYDETTSDYICANDNGGTDNQQLSITSTTTGNTTNYTLSLERGGSVNFDDRDTLYTALTGGGLALNNQAFSMVACANGQILKSNSPDGTTPSYACAEDIDTNTTYTAGTGISFNGTEINNAGVLSVSAAATAGNINSPVLVTGTAQNPQIGFTNGSAVGQIWQWNGTEWALATIPADAEGDDVIGNEVTGVTGTASGLARSGSGTVADPYTLAVSVGNGLSINTTTNEIENDGVISFGLGTSTALVNSGTAQNPLVDLKPCSTNGYVLKYNTTTSTWNCAPDNDASGTTSFSVSDGTTTETVGNGDTITFIGNEGLVATVNATDTVTYGIVDGQVTTVKLADGSVTSTKITDGTIATIDLSNGSVTNAKLANDSLTVSAGIGLTGGGVVALGTTTTLDLQACADGQILKYDETTSDYICANDSGGTDDQQLSISSSLTGNTRNYTVSLEDGGSVNFDDRDTLYSALTGGGLSLNNQAFSLIACASGQILKSNSVDGTTPSYACAEDIDTDTNTTYTAGTGIAIDGSNVISNTGVLSVSSATTGGNVNSPILLGGTAGNPAVGFADGANVGEFWQWNGTEWALAQLPVDAEGDDVIGNEVTGVTGTSSGLARSGTGTAVNPYTLAVNVGTGLSINASNQITNDGVISFGLGASTALVNSGTAQNPLIDLKPCADGEVLRYETITGTWDCVNLSSATNYSFAISDGTTTQTVNNGNTISFIAGDSLAATISATDQVTYGLVDGGVTTVKLATGAVVESKLADGAVTTVKINDGAVTGAKIADGTVANTDLANDSLTVNAGIGLAGGGVVALGGSTMLSLQACADGQVLKYDETTSDYICAEDDGGTDSQTLSITSTVTGNTTNYDLSISGGNTVELDDRDTLYTALAGGGLALSNQAFSLMNCASDNQVLKYDLGTGNWVCADDIDTDTDTNTTYDAGTGLSLTGTTFNVNVGTGLGTDGSNNLINTGVLIVGGDGSTIAVTGGSGDNPTVGFVDGANIGDIWQWNGTAWELAQLPPGAVEQDGIIGNEVVGGTGTSNGLTRSGAGTAVSPYTLAVNVGTGLSINGTNQIQNDGVLSFSVGASTALTSTGGQNPLVDLKPCADGEVLRYNVTGSTWDCVNLSSATNYSFNISDGTTSQTISNLDTVSFIDGDGLLATVSATDQVTYGIADSGVTTIKLADGSIVTNKLADGAVTSAKIADGTVSNTDLANSSLTVTAGDGLSGGGLVALGAATTLNLQPCTADQILKYNGTTTSWECAADNGGDGTGTDSQTLSISNASGGGNTITYDLTISSGNTVQFDDRDTLYTAATTGGLTLASGAFSLLSCADGQILKYDAAAYAGAGGYVCAADGGDGNTTYSAGTGLSLSGTTFNINVGMGLGTDGSNNLINTGVITVGATSTGGNINTPLAVSGTTQNPTVGFSNGTADGQFWQWNVASSAWELAALPADNDTTYTAGNGLQLVATEFSVDAPTCSGTDKLSWNGTAFVCGTDVDTNTTYTAGAGIAISGGNVVSNTGVISFNITDGTTSEIIGDAETITFIDGDGLNATVTAGNNVSYGIVDGGVTTVKLADGSVTNAKLGLSAVDSGKILNNSVANIDLFKDSLTVTAGDGLSGGGTVALGATTTLNLQACADGQILKYDDVNGWTCEPDNGGTDSQTLSFNDATNQLTITGGNTVTIPDTNTLYSALTAGGLTLSGTAFSLQTCAVGQVLKSTNGTAPTYSCANDIDTDTNTTYSAGTGISFNGTQINNAGVLSVTGSGAIASSGGQTPSISLATSANFVQTGGSLDLSNSGASAGTYGNSGVSVARLTVDAKGRITSVSNRSLPTASASVTGVLSAANFATFAAKENALTFNAPISRSGNTISFNLTASGTTGATSSASGLEISGGGLSVLRGCADNQLLKWNNTTGIWSCAADIDTDTDTDNQTLSFNDGTNVLTISGGNNVTITDDDTTYAAGNGLNLAGNTFAINAPTCTGTDKLTWNGTAFVCTADTDTDTNTTYTAAANGGLTLTGTAFSLLTSCTDGQILKYDTGTSSWVCAADGDDTPGVSSVNSLAGALILASTDETNQIGISEAGSTITLSLPQDIGTTSSPTFAGITLNGTLTANGNSILGNAAADTVTITGTIQGGLVFEGATADAFESSLAFADPTADRTITLPDATGTVCLQSSTACGFTLDSEFANAFVNGGNSFGGAATLGTNDNQALAFETNGTTAMTILANGNVGIGIINPTDLLHLDGKLRFVNAIEDGVNGNVKIFTGTEPESVAQGSLAGTALTNLTNYGQSGNGLILQYGGTSDGGGIKLTDDGLAIWGAADENLLRVIDEDSNAVRFVIDDIGNVGIGTTAPAANLHIADSEDAYLLLDSTDGTAGKEVAIKYSNFETGANYWWTGMNQDNNYSIAYGTAFTDSNIIMAVSAQGEIGIGAGNDNPGYTLDVAGDIYATGQFILEGTTINGSETSFSANPTADRTITFPDATGTVCLDSGNCNYQASGNYFAQDGNSFGGIATLGTNDNFALNFKTNNTQRLSLAANGDIVLGAGDGNPQNDVTIRGSAASGTDIPGVDIIFEAANGTGSGGSGDIVFRTAAPAGGGAASGDQWCNDTTGVTCTTDWDNRKKITLDNSASSENLTNFKALVKLNASRIDYSKTQNAGQDIRFVDPNNNTVALPHEIENWNEAGDSYVWVEIPQVNQASSTDYIWMYYNNGSVGDGQDVANVWTGQRVVQHLEESGSCPITYTDSATPSLNGSCGGTGTPPSATGQIYNARDFSSSSHIEVPAAHDDGMTNAFTVSAWVNADRVSGVNTILRNDNTNGDRGIHLRIWDGTANTYTNSGGTIEETRGATPLNTGQWYYLTGRYDGSTLKVYVNGVEDGSDPQSGNVGLTNTVMTIGAGSTTQDDPFDGRIDEVRYSQAALSPERIEANYLTMTDAMNTYGTEEAQASGSGSDPNTLVERFRIAADGEITMSGVVTLRSSVDSTSAFSVQNADASKTLLNVNTASGTVSLVENINFNSTVGTTYRDESFESTGFPPTDFSGDFTRDTAEAFDGTASAGSTNTVDSSESRLTYSFNIPVESTISFYWKVSSEATYDFLHYCIDDTDCTTNATVDGSISGEVGWTRVTQAVPAGSHTITWTYEKDNGASAGADQGWVDKVVLGNTGTATISTSGTALNFNTSGTNSLTIAANGNVGIGTAAPGALLDVAGTFEFDLNTGGDTTIGVCKDDGDGDGTNINLVECNGTASDIAEFYPTKPGVEPGDVVAISGETFTYIEEEADLMTGQYTGKTKKTKIPVLEKASQDDGKAVMGIVSTNPYRALGRSIIKQGASNPLPIALTGRVPVKISPGSAPIEPGDPLMASGVAGRAERAAEAGFVIGRALEAWTPASGTDTIMVNAGSFWFNPRLVGMDELETSLLEGGIVTDDTVFMASVMFEGPVSFLGEATFKGNVTITGKVKLSGDQVNQAVLPTGQTRVEVRFGGRYASAPYITVTPRGLVATPYGVEKVTDSGFVIVVGTPQARDVRFDWHAFMKNE